MKLFGVRVARPCYNKFWRCPGWAGSGWKHNKKGRSWCENGGASISGMNWEKRWVIFGKRIYAPSFMAWTCSTCGTLVLPSVVRYIDPRHWLYVIMDLPSRIKFAYLDWQDNRR